MLTKKLLSITLILAVSTTIFAGCGSKAATNTNSASSSVSTGKAYEPTAPVTITFWHTFSDTEKDIFNKNILPKFEAAHPNIKVKAVAMPTNGLKQQVVQAVAGKSGPDVMRMDIIWVPEFANMGALQDVGSYDTFTDIKGKSFEAPMSTTSWKGHYYGVPQDTNTKAAIFDKAALQEAGLTDAPKTMDDLISAAEKIKGNHKNGLIGIGGNDTWSMSPWFLSLGGKYTDKDYTKAEGYINSSDSVAALQQIVKLNDEGLIGKSLLGGQPDTWSGIKKNDYLAIDDGPWFYSILKDEANQKSVVATMPKGKGGSISVVGGEDLVMFKSSKDPKAVWEFMKFMSSTDIQKEFALEAAVIPTNKEAANDSQVVADPVIKTYVEQLKTAWARIPNPKFEEMNDKIQKAFETAVRHKGEPKDVLNQLAKDIDALFAQSK